MLKLYDLPASNHCARVRMILYYKNVDFELIPAATKSDEYIKLNPFGKAPLLIADGQAIAESDTIARFVGFEPTLESDRVCRLHDVYLAPLQGALYKQGGPWSYLTRGEALDEFEKQLGNLERFVEPAPYLLGSEPGHADVAVFPTLVFAERMLPKFDRQFALGPKLRQFWDFMTSGQDDVAMKVLGEMRAGLDQWEANDRWATILGAGLRDDKPATIFDKIISRDIPADIVYEDDRCLAFKDINPVAPAHILLIPKQRAALTQLRFATDDHALLLGHLMTKVGHIAKLAGLDDYRLVVNDGAEAGQSVFHLHLHIIGGRPLKWPPG